MRARTHSSDCARIKRQRCVIASLAEATPTKVLGSFRGLTKTFHENFRTDIPAKNLPLASSRPAIHLDRVTSIGFMPPEFERARDPGGYSIPDVVKIRAAVAGVIAGNAATAGSQAAVSGSACA